MPRMRLIDSYADQEKMGRLPSTAHAGYLLRTAPDWDYVAACARLGTGRSSSRA
jgi:L-lactate dehydrogenase (cytochrome)